MKTVYKSSMVAHLWANQSQEHARTSSDNFSFRGPEIYSYRTLIGRIVTKRGRRAALLTTRHYSITTAGHLSDCQRALGSIETFHVGHVANERGSQAANLDGYKKRIIETAQKAQRARSNKEYLLSGLESLVSEANKYAEFFGLKTRFKIPTDLDLSAEREKAKKEELKAFAKHEKQRQEQEQRTAEREKQLAVDIERWKVGEIDRLPYHSGCYLRIKGPGPSNSVYPNMSTTDRIIQTSQGAEVPLDHAIKLLPMIRSGRTYEHNGYSLHVGSFVVDSIDEQGNLKAGCHYILRAEMERIASQLGLTDVVSEVPPAPVESEVIPCA